MGAETKHASAAAQSPRPVPRWARTPTLWARIAARVLDFAESRGGSRPDLLRRSGLSGNILADPDGRVPMEAAYRLIEAAVEATGDPHFGLHYAQNLEAAALEAVSFVRITSATLGDAVTRAVRYQRICSDGEHIASVRRGTALHLTFGFPGSWRPAHHQVAALMVYDITRNVRRGLELDNSEIQIHFRTPAPPDPGIYERALAARIRFGALVDEVVLPESVANTPLPRADEDMCRFFERHLQTQLASLPQEQYLANWLRNVIEERIKDHAIPSELIRLDTVANQLGMSVRTLQRRLRSEGYSLNELVDDVRREQAGAYLHTPMTIAEIATKLGYSEASAFHRAFKRWTGATPEEFRRRQ